MRLTSPAAAAVLTVLTVLAVGTGPAAGAASTAPVDVDCSTLTVDDRPTEATARSRPLDELRIDDAWRLLGRQQGLPGTGQRVAVLDSGISSRAGLPVVEAVSVTGLEEISDYHGTAVAGLVSGPRRSGVPPLPVGIAPGAGLVSVRVYDSAQPGDGEVAPETSNLAAGLRWVAANADRLGIGVANVSLAVPPSDELAAAVRAVQDSDVVVVAGSGNRPVEGDPLFDRFGEFRSGEDAAGAVFPAGYRRVVAVGATADGVPTEDGGSVDVLASVLQSSAIAVAAPTYGAVTASVSGGTCVLPSIATSWSAAEVSGLVALLRAAYPRDNARQVVARLVETADGTPRVRTVLTGAGVVQPVEALSRPLRPRASGALPRNAEEPDPTPPATIPAPPEDRLAQTRRNAVWLGLIGACALTVAALLRPLLARRRRAGG